jgi:hypothetical protein
MAQLRTQAKLHGLLGTVLPYETEGSCEVSAVFDGNHHVRRGNVLDPKHVSFEGY